MTDQSAISTDIVGDIKKQLVSIRAMIQRDGGDIDFVSYVDGTVYVRLLGACIGCPAVSYTVKMGVEKNLKERLAIIEKVVVVE